MTISARLRRLRLRISALLTICAMTLAVASCGQPDTRTVITVWSWEPSMTTLIAVVWWHSGGFNLLVFIGLGIFWLVKRQMPYDLI